MAQPGSVWINPLESSLHAIPGSQGIFLLIPGIPQSSPPVQPSSNGETVAMRRIVTRSFHAKKRMEDTKEVMKPRSTRGEKSVIKKLRVVVEVDPYQYPKGPQRLLAWNRVVVSLQEQKVITKNKRELRNIQAFVGFHVKKYASKLTEGSTEQGSLEADDFERLSRSLHHKFYHQCGRKRSMGGDVDGTHVKKARGDTVTRSFGSECLREQIRPLLPANEDSDGEIDMEELEVQEHQMQHEANESIVNESAAPTGLPSSMPYIIVNPSKIAIPRDPTQVPAYFATANHSSTAKVSPKLCTASSKRRPERKPKRQYEPPEATITLQKLEAVLEANPFRLRASERKSAWEFAVRLVAERLSLAGDYRARQSLRTLVGRHMADFTLRHATKEAGEGEELTRGDLVLQQLCAAKTQMEVEDVITGNAGDEEREVPSPLPGNSQDSMAEECFEQTIDTFKHTAAFDWRAGSFWCSLCSVLTDEPCETHGQSVDDSPYRQRSFATLPANLQIRVNPTGRGVYAKKYFPPQTIFGPLIAPLRSAPRKNGQFKFAIASENDAFKYWRLESDDLCNWMKHVQLAKNPEEQNLMAYVRQDQIYFAAIRSVAVEEQLKVWYSRSYGSSIGKPPLVAKPLTTGDLDETAGTANYEITAAQSADSVGADTTSMDEGPTGLFVEGFPSQSSFENDVSVENYFPQRSMPQESSVLEEAVEMYPPSPEILPPNERMKKSAVVSAERLKRLKLAEAKKYTRIMPSQRLKSVRQRELLHRRGAPVSKAAVIGYKYPCEKCPAEFRVEALLKLHELKHVEDLVDDGTIEKKCPACHTLVDSLEELAAHMDRHKKKPPKYGGVTRFKCELCRHHFASEKHLERHVYRMHSENSAAERIFECTVCKERLLTNAGLKSHMKIHSGKHYFECPVCLQGFNFGHEMQEHSEGHCVDGRYPCRICTNTYEDFGQLKRHLRISHHPKTFICDVCGHAVKSAGRLQKHMTVHMTTMPEFVCQICNRHFKASGSLKQHMKCHDPNKIDRRKIPRDENAPKTTKPGYIAPRLRMDYEEFPYKCEECHLGFLRRGMLMQHVQKFHPDVPLDSIPDHAIRPNVC